MVTFGFLRKVKDGIVTVGKKIGSAVKTVAAPIVKAGLHLAPAIGTVVGAMYGSPEIGGLIGSAVNKVGRKIGAIS